MKGGKFDGRFWESINGIFRGGYIGVLEGKICITHSDSCNSVRLGRNGEKRLLNNGRVEAEVLEGLNFILFSPLAVSAVARCVAGAYRQHI